MPMKTEAVAHLRQNEPVLEAINDARFELAGELPVQVEFVLDTALADKLLEVLHMHKLNLLYVRYAVESGVL